MMWCLQFVHVDVLSVDQFDGLNVDFSLVSLDVRAFYGFEVMLLILIFEVFSRCVLIV